MSALTKGFKGFCKYNSRPTCTHEKVTKCFASCGLLLCPPEEASVCFPVPSIQGCPDFLGDYLNILAIYLGRGKRMEGMRLIVNPFLYFRLCFGHQISEIKEKIVDFCDLNFLPGLQNNPVLEISVDLSLFLFL